MPTMGEVERCEYCGHIISKRRIGLYLGLIKALEDVYKWCIVENKHEFTRKEVKHLFQNESASARFGDLVMFGGLVYKHGKGHYGLNMERCAAFFKGEYLIPTTALKDPISKEVYLTDYKLIHEIPHLGAYLDSQGEFVAEYRLST